MGSCGNLKRAENVRIKEAIENKKNLMAKQTEETDTNVNVYSTNTSKYLYVCVLGEGVKEIAKI